MTRFENYIIILEISDITFYSKIICYRRRNLRGQIQEMLENNAENLRTKKTVIQESFSLHPSTRADLSWI